MGLDASQVLGSAQVAGAKVSPRGMGRSITFSSAGMSGGAVGAVVGAAASGRANRRQQEIAATSETPKLGRFAYLAVTGDEVALIKLKSGLVSQKLTEVVARVPRSQVASAELGSGQLAPELTVSFRDGDTWLLEVPRISKKDAEDVVRMLST